MDTNSKIVLPKTEHAQALIADAMERQAAAKGVKTKRLVERAMTTRTDQGQLINPFLIHVKPDHNVRDFTTEEAIEDVEKLALSISKVGVIKNLDLSFNSVENRFELEDGETRLRACFLAMEKHGWLGMAVPYQTVKALDPAEAMARTNLMNSGRRFSDASLMKMVTYLRDVCNWTPEKIADKSGVSLVKQRQLDKIEALPPELRTEVDNKTVSASDMLKVVAESPDMKSAIEQITARKKVAEASGSLRATRKHDQGAFNPKATALAAFREIGAKGGFDRSKADVTTVTLPNDVLDAVFKLVGYRG